MVTTIRRRVASISKGPRLPTDPLTEGNKTRITYGVLYRRTLQYQEYMHEVASLVAGLRVHPSFSSDSRTARAEALITACNSAINQFSNKTSGISKREFEGAVAVVKSHLEELMHCVSGLAEIDRAVADTVAVIGQYASSAQAVLDGCPPVSFKTTFCIVAAIQKACDQTGVNATVRFNQAPPGICADQFELISVFRNLLVNAHRAVRHRDDPRIEVLISEGGQTIFISVTDNGVGMRPDQCASLFTPGFTTRDDARNHGIGLAASWRIVQSHGGTIRVTSKEGEGSAFTVLLPLVN